MSHHIYHTRGIILSSSPSGESNRFYKIFTEELGLIGGAAQSVRVAKSKLKYTLQDYSLVTVDLVRGKEVWRIVSAGAWQSLDNIKRDEVRIKLFASFCALLSRLLQGEGRDQWLFDEIVNVTYFLEKNKVEQDHALSLETLFAFRVLAHLGYLNPAGYEQYFEQNAYTVDILRDFGKIRLEIIPTINAALDASHL